MYYNQIQQAWKTFFLTSLNTNSTNELGKMLIYSPSSIQKICLKLIKRFTNYIPTNIIQNNLIEQDLHFKIDEIVNDTDFEKSEKEK